MKEVKAFAADLCERASVQLPGLPYLGFAFWFAWNLVAFSGSSWLTPEDSGSYIMYFFTAHLVASVCTLLAINAAMPRYSARGKGTGRLRRHVWDAGAASTRMKPICRHFVKDKIVLAYPLGHD